MRTKINLHLLKSAFEHSQTFDVTSHKTGVPSSVYYSHIPKNVQSPFLNNTTKGKERRAKREERRETGKVCQDANPESLDRQLSPTPQLPHKIAT
jgi:hypothetical protein